MLLWTGMDTVFPESQELRTSYKADGTCWRQLSMVFVASLCVWPWQRTGVVRIRAIIQLVYELLYPLEITRVWAPVLSYNSFCSQKLQASEEIRQEQAHDSQNKMWAVMSGSKTGHWSHDPHTVCGRTRLSFPPCESSDWLLDLEEHQVQSSWVWRSMSNRMLEALSASCRF